MKNKTLINGVAVLLVTALAVLGMIWGVTGETHYAPIETSVTEELKAPPTEFEGKYTIETMAAKITATGVHHLVETSDLQEDIPVSLSINDEPVNFGESGPIISKGIAMVPVKEVFGDLGFEVIWNEEAKRVSVTNEANEIIFTMGQMLYLFNGEPLMLDVPAQIIEGKTMIPLRVILDCLDAEFEWLEPDKHIRLVVD